MLPPWLLRVLPLEAGAAPKDVVVGCHAFSISVRLFFEVSTSTIYLVTVFFFSIVFIRLHHLDGLGAADLDLEQHKHEPMWFMLQHPLFFFW